MNEEEMRYRVSAVVTSTLQIVVQARSAEEAEAFSDAIDFDKWSVLSTFESFFTRLFTGKDLFEFLFAAIPQYYFYSLTYQALYYGTVVKYASHPPNFQPYPPPTHSH